MEQADPRKLSSSPPERARRGVTTSSPLKGAGFRCCRAPGARARTLVAATFGAEPAPSPPLLFSFSSHEPCYPGCSAEAAKEDGEPSYLRMITIVNIHGWFTLSFLTAQTWQSPRKRPQV